MSTVTTDAARKQQLRKVYFDIGHPGGYGGVKALERATQLPHHQVEQWLREQRTYTLHRPARKRFPTRHYQVSKRDRQWQADLVEMIPFAKQNSGYKYMLTVIDVFSRYAWAVPLKSKSAGEVVRGLKSIFDSDGRHPRFLQTDQGKEFENKHVVNFLRDSHDIVQFSVKSAYKAAMVERLNRTLKARMWRYFTHNGTRRWIDILPNLMDAYNRSKHRVLGRAPIEVTPTNEMQVWQHLYGKKKKPSLRKKTKFKVGDTVRLSKVKSVFAKGYLPNWTEEEFRVSHVDRKASPIMYKVKDVYGEEIEGKFYPHELQHVANPKRIYMIERILRRRGSGPSREVLVKWLGYPEKSWIKESTLINKPS